MARAWVASGRYEAWRRADETAVEEGAEGAGEDGPPFLQAGQLLCILRQAAQEVGDGGERARRGFSLGVRTGDADRGLPRMARSRRDGRQKQRPACDRLAMQVRIDETNEDVPPVVKEGEHARRQSTAGEIVRGEAAPAPLILHFVENIFSVSPIAV